MSYLTPGFPTELFELLAERLGAELFFESEMSGPPPGEDPFADGTYDLGWVCSTSFVDLALRCTVPSVQLAGVAWVPQDPGSQGRPVYFGDIVVPADSPVRRFEDLAGLRMGCNDPVSLSGNYALTFALRDRDLADDFCQMEFTGGHHASLDALTTASGPALDAAVVDSVVRIGRARHDEEVASLRVVERLGPWPVQPLVVRSTMPSEERARLAAVLLGLNEDPTVRAALADASLERLVAVGPDHYAAVRSAMTASA